MALDEMRAVAGVEEDVLKVILSGDMLPRRRNHEAETYLAKWNKSGKSWSGNCRDLPYIGSVMESCWARRFWGHLLACEV